MRGAAGRGGQGDRRVRFADVTEVTEFPAVAWDPWPFAPAWDLPRRTEPPHAVAWDLAMAQTGWHENGWWGRNEHDNGWWGRNDTDRDEWNGHWGYYDENTGWGWQWWEGQ